ncbi:MAG: archaemetzincin family Zn-dependent metalloprotease [Thermodesulfobacteriota bacterium]|nr:archaemetzincin family Zn-dependent metalloprotease [Thermodesulfobacteriota bacterium]
MSGPREHKIVISPIGDIDSELLREVSKEIERVFSYETEADSLLLDIGFALDPARTQYHSTPILEKLESLAPPHATKVIAITHVDLFIPILTHVYGEAQLNGKACMVSTYRLRENLSPIKAEEMHRQRAVKEAVHELGHTFGLRHCKDPACIMHYCRTVRDVDRKSDQLCRYCKTLLGDETARLGRTPPIDDLKRNG